MRGIKYIFPHKLLIHENDIIDVITHIIYFQVQHLSFQRKYWGNHRIVRYNSYQYSSCFIKNNHHNMFNICRSNSTK